MISGAGLLLLILIECASSVAIGKRTHWVIGFVVACAYCALDLWLWKHGHIRTGHR